jgi:hypothetical protein
MNEGSVFIERHIMVPPGRKLHLIPDEGYCGDIVLVKVLYLKNNEDMRPLGYRFVTRKESGLFKAKTYEYPIPKNRYYHPAYILNRQTSLDKIVLKSSDVVYIYIVGDAAGMRPSSLLIPKDTEEFISLLDTLQDYENEIVTLRQDNERLQRRLIKQSVDKLSEVKGHLEAYTELEKTIGKRGRLPPYVDEYGRVLYGPPEYYPEARKRKKGQPLEKIEEYKAEFEELFSKQE